MAMTSSIVSFKKDTTLMACGIDSEHIERFAGFDPVRKEPSPLIFSKRETEHCFSLVDPSIGLCASFCCKEATCKALKQPFNFDRCELFWNPGQEKYHFNLSEELCKEYKIKEKIAQVELSEDGECTVAVFLLG